MGRLTITFGRGEGEALGTPLPAEIIASDLAVVDRVTLLVGQERQVQVEPDTYLVRAQLPSGRVLKGFGEVSARRGARVDLGRVNSPREWLQSSVVLGDIADTTRPPGPALAERSHLWLTAWERQGPTWAEVSWPKHALGHDDHHMAFDLPILKDRLRMVQLGGSGIPWRLVAVPPSPAPPRVVVAPDANADDLDSGVTISVSTQDRDADMLLRYLSQGDMPSAEVAGAGLQEALEEGFSRPVAAAERFARDKRFNPGGAAIGFYHLLRVHADERLRDWPSNFVRWFPWLPDAHVIRGWQAMRAIPKSDVALARRCFVDAAAAGVPVFSEGLRLLLDGLELLARTAGAQDRGQVLAAAERIGLYAAAADFAEPMTTFTGVGPDVPSLGGPVGAPFGLQFAHPVNAPSAHAVAFQAQTASALVRMDAPAAGDAQTPAPAAIATQDALAAIVAARAIGRVVVRDGKGRIEAEATGSLVSRSLFMTTFHALPHAEAARRATVVFGAPGAAAEPVVLRFEPERFLVADEALDFTVIAVEGEEGDVAGLGFNRLARDRDVPSPGDRIATVQQVAPGRQELGLSGARITQAGEDFVRFDSASSTIGSGTAVFDDAWELVALVHVTMPSMSGGQILRCTSEAVRSGRVLETLRQRATDATGWALIGELLERPAVAVPPPETEPRRESALGESVPGAEEATLSLSIPLQITVRTTSPSHETRGEDSGRRSP
jgi:hypothetical protein